MAQASDLEKAAGRRTSAAYEADVVAWAREQARLLRAGRFDLLDIEHIADEIEDVGKSEQRELASRMAILLLKWCFQPERRSRSWELTIRDQRAAIERRLRRTPSLKESLRDPDWQADAWSDALSLAEKETGLERAQFPSACAWQLSHVLSEGWLPE